MTNLERHQRLAEARERADLARAQFASAMDDTRSRFLPHRLKRDATDAISDRIEDAKDNVRQSIRQHPILTATAVAGSIALLFWSPARLTLLYSMRGARLLWLNRYLWSARNDE